MSKLTACTTTSPHFDLGCRHVCGQVCRCVLTVLTPPHRPTSTSGSRQAGRSRADALVSTKQYARAQAAVTVAVIDHSTVGAPRRDYSGTTAEARRCDVSTLDRRKGGWLARHSTHQGDGPASSLGRVSMGTAQCAVVVSLVISLVISSLKSKLWLRSIQSRAEKHL